MSRPSLPRISKADLRDVASDERVERIWGRLSQDLEALRARPAPRPSRAPAWALAAACVAFGTGLVVGRVLWQAPPAVTPPVAATHDRATLDVFAAGSQERTYTLPGGGVVTLTPGSMIEVERTGGSDLRLRLLAGEASFDTGQAFEQPLAIVSGEATIAAGPGSMVHVQKRADNLDVRVVGGSAEVTSPAGTRALRKGEQMEDVPTRKTTTAVDPPPRVTPVPTALAPRVARSEASAAAVATEPTWRELHAAGKFSEAASALRTSAGSLSLAVLGAASADELMKINDLARVSGEPQAALIALKRVADEFASSAYGPIAARQLSKHYEAAGQPDQAKKYRDQAAALSVFGEDALCDQMRAEHRAGHNDEAAQRATEYLGKYPNGRCKDEANGILAGGDADGDDEAAPAEPEPGASGAPSGSAPAASGSASGPVPPPSASKP